MCPLLLRKTPLKIALPYLIDLISIPIPYLVDLTSIPIPYRVDLRSISIPHLVDPISIPVHCLGSGRRNHRRLSRSSSHSNPFKALMKAGVSTIRAHDKPAARNVGMTCPATIERPSFLTCYFSLLRVSIDAVLHALPRLRRRRGWQRSKSLETSSSG